MRRVFEGAEDLDQRRMSEGNLDDHDTVADVETQRDVATLDT